MNNNLPLKIGITGSIGSGKTTVCHIFESLGIPVYYADGRAKWLMVNDPRLVSGVKKEFGEEAYYANGTLNRHYLAQTVFHDAAKLKVLNALVHPIIADDSERWHHGQEGVPYTLKEAALLFESNNHLKLDKVIAVSCPENIRIQRVIKRDGMTEEEVRARMDKQMPDEEKIARADYIINNDGQTSLVQQVVKIHNTLKKIWLMM
ncbi:MAG: dephospho-CoA kinase [Chitinophagales bacterium]|nr:dephospho-CoA kinase [Chitinophagales bacterium]